MRLLSSIGAAVLASGLSASIRPASHVLDEEGHIDRNTWGDEPEVQHMTYQRANIEDVTRLAMAKSARRDRQLSEGRRNQAQGAEIFRQLREAGLIGRRGHPSIGGKL